MATLGAGAIIYGAGGFPGLWAGLGPFGLVVGSALLVGGAMMDAKFAEGLAKKPNEPQSPKLVGLPTHSNNASQPRIWALGRRMRVPVHLMWQSEKRLVTTTSRGPKGTPGTQQERVYVDCALGVNDRLTRGVAQMVAMGKLIYWAERKLVSIRTHEMAVTAVAGNLVLTMNSTSQPDWASKFEAGDVCVLQGFVCAPGTPNINVGNWRVVSVTARSSTPSVLTLAIYSGQSLVGLSAYAGSVVSPAEVFRADDRWASEDIQDFGGSGAWDELAVYLDYGQHSADTFSIGDRIFLARSNGTTWVPLVTSRPIWQVQYKNWIAPGRPYLTLMADPPLPAGTIGFPLAISGTDAACLLFSTSALFTSGVFPSTFIPSEHFYVGSLTQEADPTIYAAEGVAAVPGYRGTAYQVLEDFDLTMFGGSVPPMLEALIDVEYAMTWAEAVRETCVHFGLAAAYVDTSAMREEFFEGMYLRGVMEGANALQSLLLAGQLVCQDRNGVLCFVKADDCDVVQVQNGALYSDLMHIGNGDGKLEFGDATHEDAPTSVGIMHQDPDNFYAEGYQPYANRFPSAARQENVRTFDLNHMVLTQQQARDLAATLMRRSYVSARQVRMRLPAAYLDVLENDLVTLTDDAGNDITVRVLQRDIGSNFEVLVTGVTELVGSDATVVGSPVQSTAGRVLAPPPRLAPVVAHVLDIPPLRDVDSLTPGLLVCAGAINGGNWAGCTVYRSVDAGANWTAVGTLSQQASIGVTTTDLAAATSSEVFGSSTLVWDAVSTVDIELQCEGPIPIVSLTVQNVLDGLGWWVARSSNNTYEVFAARTVTQLGTRQYRLSNLLRGIRGTILDCQTIRPAGAAITYISGLPDLNGLWLDLLGQSSQPVQEYRFVPPGEDVSNVGSVFIVCRWHNVRPFPVRDVTKTINGTTSVRFTVNHWTRKRLALGSTGPYPLDEPYEEYRFDLWDVTTYDATTSRRVVCSKTITSRGTGARGLRDKWVEFTAAEVALGGYTLGPGETFWLDVVQVGDYGESQSNVREY